MSAPQKPYLSPELILRLQTTAGNQAVQKLIERRRSFHEAARQSELQQRRALRRKLIATSSMLIVVSLLAGATVWRYSRALAVCLPLLGMLNIWMIAWRFRKRIFVPPQTPQMSSPPSSARRASG